MSIKAVEVCRVVNKLTNIFCLVITILYWPKISNEAYKKMLGMPHIDINAPWFRHLPHLFIYSHSLIFSSHTPPDYCELMNA
jgi:hypothetical protein